MDFTFSEEQTAIRDSVERMFADLCDDDRIKKLAQNDTAVHTQLWQQLAAAGIFGLPFAEEHGGLGLSLVELCLILELQGKSVAPIPLMSSIVESAMTIADSSNESLKQSVLPKVIQGNLMLSPVRAYTGLQIVEPLAAQSNEDGFVLNGRSGFVPYAGEAGGLVITVQDENCGDVLLYVASDAEGVSVVRQKSISGESAGYVVFDSVAVTEQNVIAQGKQATQMIAVQQQRSWIALAAMQVGALDEGLKRTAAYVSERKQFGRPLGGFQAVSQQAANAYMEIESLRSVYWRALDDVQAGNDFSVSAAVAKYWVAEAGHKAAHTVLHLHGGMGQDLDYPIHRFFLWAKQCERYLGSADKMSALVGNKLINSDRENLEQLCR